MRLLVLGGTKFLGRGIVDAALGRGHEVTLFNRGVTDPDAYPEVELLRGDRDGNLAALERRSFDAVIDPSGYLPRVVRASAELLRGAVGHYVFVSSISAYDFPLPPWYSESAPVSAALADADAVTGETYGPLKVGCEQVVRDVFPGAHTNVRAGLIVGPHDPTGRFTYWPLRIARGGEVLAPGDPSRLVQFVDVRDLGDWLVRAAEARLVGDFNATGPQTALSMGELLESCVAACGSEAQLVWIPDDFLVERGAGTWMELPLWLVGEDVSFLQADVSKAVAAGLRFRPLPETVSATLEWAAEHTGSGELASGMALGDAGLDPTKEGELLAAWRGR
jgi:nucleoside-diphosphate-sugar epimerase